MLDPFSLKAVHVRTGGNYTRVAFIGNVGKAVVSDPFDYSQRMYRAILDWLLINCEGVSSVDIGWVDFELESDAMLCYLAYS